MERSIRRFGTSSRGRLDIVRAVIQGLHRTADSLQHAKHARRGWRIENGPVSGELRFQRLEAGFLMVSLAAKCSSENFWEPDHFGLKGLDTAVLTLRLPGFKQGLTGSMTELFWSRPFFPNSPRGVPPKTQFLLWKDSHDRYGVLLPLAAGDAVSTLRGTPQGLELSVSTGMEGLHRMEAPLFVAGFGRDPYELTRNAYRTAARFMGKESVLRVNKPYPEPFEYLGWCTWDAFYRRVNARGVLRKMEEFRKKGIRPGFVLIDDGWYPMKDARLVDTRTDRRKFPGGLLPLIRRIKRRFGIPFVGAWHCHTGYWMGVHPHHRLPLPEKETPQGDPAGGYYFPSLEEEGARIFFAAWHRRMRREGVDFVKVDGQGSVARFCVNRLPFTRAAANTERALQVSCDRHFKGRLLNCMSMGHDLMWTWDRSNVTRSSNDFLPRKRGSFADHALWNAYNSFWLSNVTWCDWDMWWTDHEAAAFHQSLRAVSGGPVYISDRVGATRGDLLGPLVLADGRLLRCDEVGVPTEDCLLTDTGKAPRALKIMNRAGATGILGLFNACTGRDVIRTTFRPSDIRGLRGARFAVRCWHNGESRLMGREDVWKVRLQKEQPLVFSAVPVKDGFAAIGLTNKIISPKTIERVTRRGKSVEVVLKEGGDFTAYCASTPSRVQYRGRVLPFVWKAGWLHVVVPCGNRPHPTPIQITIRLT